MNRQGINKVNIIDPHLHLFDLSQGDYSWLKPECPPFWSDKNVIAKSFSEQNLTLSAPLALAGFVHIEAGFDNEQPWREIAWLENTCHLPFRSIALLDITLSKALFLQQLKTLIAYKSVVGVRYILDDDALNILTDKNSQNNLATLAANNLSFELQMPLHDTNAIDCLLAMLSAIPDLMLCINHAGSPLMDSVNYTLWQENLKRIAAFDNVFIKCSGYEMVKRDHCINWRHKIISQCIEYFSVKRVMLASNFPLSLWQYSYQETWLSNVSLSKALSESLSKSEPKSESESESGSKNPKVSLSHHDIEQLCYQNAYCFYKFKH
ncbi:amidohydrolase [Colwellia sp. Arc7-635]|nr:amidohydrolase [Colwellia sp. Arc7-635]